MQVFERGNFTRLFARDLPFRRYVLIYVLAARHIEKGTFRSVGFSFKSACFSAEFIRRILYIQNNRLIVRLFIDEVQLCDGFETVINSLYEEERFNIFLTGSNAFLLSSDLATLFGGRVFEISLYPFSFSEYLLYYPQTDIDDAFDKYVTTGGMAGSYLYRNSADSENICQI